tara:strand:- start:15360 stop:16478 length:1119 start_codon:yes stop_codon:yes gene_type:complete
MKLRVFNEFNDELKHIWKSLESESNSFPFQAYEWQRYWNEHVGQPKYKMNLCIVVCSYENKIRAIFPFGIKTIMFSRVLTFLGEDEADYSAPLISSYLSSDEFKKFLPKVFKIVPPHDAIYFKNIPKLINKSENFLLKNISSKETGYAYSIKLPSSFEDYAIRLSKSMLKDNKRMIRRLSEIGELKFNVLTQSDDFKSILKEMILQKENRYKLSGARNIFNDSSVKNFYTNIHDLLDDGLFKIHLSSLSLNNVVLATHLGIHYKDQFYYLMPTFNDDLKWSKFSLGRIHLEKLINWTIDNKINKFDFTIGAEAYKSIWCDEEMAIYTHLKINNLRGIGFYAYFQIIKLIKSNSFLKTIAVKLLSIRYSLKAK